MEQYRWPTLDSLYRLQSAAWRASVLLIALGALALGFIDMVAAKGFVLGGLAGVAGLWLLQRQTIGLLQADATEVQLRAVKGALLRLPIYGGALLWAHRLEPGSYSGLLAAVVGLFLVRGVFVLLALMGVGTDKDDQ